MFHQNTNYYTIITNSYSGFRPLAMAFRFRVAKVAEMHVPVSDTHILLFYINYH